MPPLLVVEARQRVERAGVLGVLVEDADAGGDGLVDVADVALEQVRDLAPQLLARARVAREIDAPAQHLDALAVVRAGLEDALEPVDRLAVLGVDVEDRAQRRHRRRGVAQRLLLEPGDAEQQRLALVGVVGPARLLAQDLDQRRDVAGLGVQRLERGRRRLGRRRVLGVEVQHQLPGVDGGAPVAEAPAVELRRARQQIGAARDVGASRLKASSW